MHGKARLASIPKEDVTLETECAGDDERSFPGRNGVAVAFDILLLESAFLGTEVVWIGRNFLRRDGGIQLHP